jgi:hypothetical protein
LLFLLALGAAGLPAEAAAAGGGVVGSALWAYGHYLGMISVVGALVAERLLIKPGMSAEEERAVRAADTAYAVSLIALLITGALRATEVRGTRSSPLMAESWPFILFLPRSAATHASFALFSLLLLSWLGCCNL